MWKLFRTLLISGILAILPLGLTLWIVWLLYGLISNWIGQGGFIGAIVRLIPVEEMPDSAVVAIGLLLTIVVILLVGLLTRMYVGRMVYNYFERLMLAIPIMSKIYSAVKQLTDAVFARDASMAFKRVALVEFPRRGIYMIGFLTNRQVPGVEELMDEEMVSVFLMSPPNPVTGFWAIMPERDVTYLDHITVEEGFRMIMSLGISIPPEVAIRLRDGKVPTAPAEEAQ
ncbi:MAG: DUF502 domain-containing protein [Candidatus Bipolaricaulia bacterium]